MSKDNSNLDNQSKEKYDDKWRFPYLVKEDFYKGIKNPLVFLAQGLGSGCFRPMQGTWGTLGGVLVYLAIAPWLPEHIWAIWVVCACVLGIPLCSYAERKLNNKDPHSVVWDEWCGIWLAYLYMLPADWIYLILGFVIFRWLDIKKPWLIGMAERKFKRGAGIMLDDVAAGIITAVILNVLSSLIALFPS